MTRTPYRYTNRADVGQPGPVDMDISTLMRNATKAILLLWLMAPVVWGNPFYRDLARSGNDALVSGEYTQAVAEYIRAQEQDPLAAELHYNLGTAYLGQEEYEQAQQEFEKSMRSDQPETVAAAYYNRANARYHAAKREFEAQYSSGQIAENKEYLQQHIEQLRLCAEDYEETLKLTPDDADTKYNLEVIRREIKNLMRRQEEEQEQQQQQEQQQDQSEQEQSEEGEESGEQQQSSQPQPSPSGEQEEKESESSEPDQSDDQGTPTPVPAMQPESEPTPGQSGSESSNDEASAEPTQIMSISEEMARNILDNLPEQRPRNPVRRRPSSGKDW